MWRAPTLLIAVVISVATLLIPSIPLGVPGEWVWPRLELPENLAESLDRLIPALLMAAVLVAFCRFVDCRIERFSALNRMLMLGMLVTGAFFWIGIVRQAAPSPHRELRPLWVLYDKYASGYFHEAAFRTTSQAELLSTYEARMAKGDVFHEGTHPPGLFLLNWWALRATERSEFLTSFGEWTQPDSAVSVFRIMESESKFARPLTRTELSALCLVSFLTTVLTAMAAVPVFGLVRMFSDCRTAWRAAALMMTVPTISVFAPRSDVVYAFTGTLLLWMMVAGWRSQSSLARRLASLLAGTVAFVSLTISLAHLPVILAGAAFAGLSLIGPGRFPPQRIAGSASIMLSTFGGLFLVWMVLTDCSLFNVWRMNLANHAAFYDQSRRTWWKWVIVNPAELALSAGLPLSVFSVYAFFVCLKAIYREIASRQLESFGAIRFVVAIIGTWILLWLSGKNSGEAARLWCFLTPWIVISGTFGLLWHHKVICRAVMNAGSSTPLTVVQDAGSGSGPAGNESQRDWLLLLSAQLFVCTLTVGRVSGYFGFLEK